MHSTVSETQDHTQRVAVTLESGLTVKTFAKELELEVLVAEFAEASQHPVSITFIAASTASRVAPGLLTVGTRHCFSSRPEGVLAASY